LGRNVIHTDNTAATNAVNRAVQAYITQEINPIIQRVQGAANSAAQQNRLGILLARAGRIADARAAYERAAGMGSVPAMTNRGNLALIENDFVAAERWFGQALARDSENRAALRGLGRIAGR
jgi:Flp pilus assembly protein TadD